MNNLPDQVDDMRFCILDNSDPKDPDYYFIPLIFLESFNSPALVLEIDGHRIKMPVDWQILIGEAEVGDLEVVPLTSINPGRDFKAFMFNPLAGFTPRFGKIEIVDVYQDFRWFFPKLRTGQILSVPLENKESPKCAYFVKDITRQSEVVDVQKIW